MPNSLQYPLERERDLQRRWQRLLQRTIAPKSRIAAALRHSRVPSRFGVPTTPASGKR
jgi:hypothetical protein